MGGWHLGIADLTSVYVILLVITCLLSRRLESPASKTPMYTFCLPPVSLIKPFIMPP